MNVYPFVKKLLFLLDAETAHEWSLKAMALLDRIGLLRPVLFFLGVHLHSKKDHSIELMGLRFPNPVGLAAGLDKNAQYIRVLEKCGFGFIEVGTVTPLPQAGNDKPRMFRLQADHAIINRMGFNNDGVDVLLEKVKHYRKPAVQPSCLIGINIGKNKITPLENAVADYLICLRKVYPYADYVTLNISSPNTPGLRQLQYGDGLKDLLTQLKEQQAELAAQSGRYVPLLVKIAPDLEDSDLPEMAQAMIAAGIDGVIVSNTTNSRPASLTDKKQAAETGGLSGAPLTSLADEILIKLVDELQGRIPVIAVGGIMSAADAKRKLEFGASLVQIYTGFIYTGPALVTQILEKLPESNRKSRYNRH